MLDRAVTARMVSREWRSALAPPPGADAAVNGRGLCKDVDVTTEPRLLCRVRKLLYAADRERESERERASEREREREREREVVNLFCRLCLEGTIAHSFATVVVVCRCCPPLLFSHLTSTLSPLSTETKTKNNVQLDTDLLLRLLWLSSWGGNPRAADVPSWNSTFPWLRSLRVAGARWRPTAAHRVPSLRRVLGACPRLERVDATALRVLVPLAGGEIGESEGEDLLFDAAEAQLLASAALHHGQIRELELDVSVRLSLDDAAEPPLLPDDDEDEEEEEEEEVHRTRGVWESDEASPMETEVAAATEAAAAPSFSPSSPSAASFSLRLLPTSAIAADPSAAYNSAVDVVEVVLAAKTPLRVRRLSLSTPPTMTVASSSSSSSSSSFPLATGGERAALASRCLRLGKAAALGGELRTLTLDRLTPEEAAAAVAGALSSGGSGGGSKLERIEFRGVGGGRGASGNGCWSEGVAAAVADALSNSSSCSSSSSSLREIIFEGDAGGRGAEEKREVEASVLRAVVAGRNSGPKKFTVRFVEESAARRASGVAYAARAAAAAAAASANAAANAAAAAAAAPRLAVLLPAAVPV